MLNLLFPTRLSSPHAKFLATPLEFNVCLRIFSFEYIGFINVSHVDKRNGMPLFYLANSVSSNHSGTALARGL